MQDNPVKPQFLMVALFLAITPLSVIAYYHVGKVFLSNSDVGRSIVHGHGGLIKDDYDHYHRTLNLFGVSGIISAIIICVVVHVFVFRAKNQAE